MTTIAWDGKTLASDSLETVAHAIYSYNCQKLHKLKNGIAGISGELGQIQEIIKYLNGELKRADINVDDVWGIVVTNEGAFTIDTSLELVLCNDSCAAVGSGWKFAKSAMDLGLSAKEAVEHAIKYDIYSGGDVKTMDIK